MAGEMVLVEWGRRSRCGANLFLVLFVLLSIFLMVSCRGDDVSNDAGTDLNPCLGEMTDGRLFASPPFGPAFSCVQIGCDNIETVRIENTGCRDVAVSRIRLTSITSRDYGLGSILKGTQAIGVVSGATPLMLEPGESAEIEVQYIPSDAQIDLGELLVQWSSRDPNGDLGVLQETELPLTSAYFGEAIMTAVNPEMNLGYIALGEQASFSVDIENQTAGQMIGEIVAGETGAHADWLLIQSSDYPLYVNPQEQASLSFSLSPQFESVYDNTLLFVDGLEEQIPVRILATSIPDADIQFLTSMLRFEAPLQGTAEKQVEIQNRGGTSVFVNLESLHPELHIAQSEFELQPLETRLVDMTFSPEVDELDLQESSIRATYTRRGQVQETFLPVELEVLAGVIRVEPDSISFDISAFGEAVQQEIILSNLGTDLVQINDLAWQNSPLESDHFMQTLHIVDDGLDRFLAPGESTTFVIEARAISNGVGDSLPTQPEITTPNIVIGELEIRTDSVLDPIRVLSAEARVYDCAGFCWQAALNSQNTWQPDDCSESEVNQGDGQCRLMNMTCGAGGQDALCQAAGCPIGFADRNGDALTCECPVDESNPATPSDLPPGTNGMGNSAAPFDFGTWRGNNVSPQRFFSLHAGPSGSSFGDRDTFCYVADDRWGGWNKIDPEIYIESNSPDLLILTKYREVDDGIDCDDDTNISDLPSAQAIGSGNWQDFRGTPRTTSDSFYRYRYVVEPFGARNDNHIIHFAVQEKIGANDVGCVRYRVQVRSED